MEATMTTIHAQRLAMVLMLSVGLSVGAGAQVTKYVRFSVGGGAPSYGLLEGNTVRHLAGDLFTSPRVTGPPIALSEVKLLAPVVPSKVIAVGLNYRSHLGTTAPAAYPGLFAKMPTSIVGPDAEIVIPAGATNVHYEGELVVVIGRRAKNVSVADAGQYIFGITAGNDVSERNWQQADLQWFRAKAADTFGPLGPILVKGLNYNDLLLTTRLNGQVVQEQRTKDLLFDVHTIVSYISQFMTLEPGDVIYTGTPGTTRAMKNGDTVEVEIEGVGVLRNKVVGPS
jgi:2-keto-4-pentenoate hydratase/2-oxohepta-3-ene-1,7-dioic acid hydratase in catechol pathway